MGNGTYRRRKKKRPARIIGRFTLVVVMVVFMLGLRSRNRSETWEDVGRRTVHQAQKELQDHPEYPETLEELLEHNPETAEFVRDYEKEVNKEHRIDLTEELKPGEIPLFLQWDKRWGYERYGNQMIAVDGCGPVCLSMIAAGLLQDASLNPLNIARFAEKNGYYVDGSGSSWSLMSDGARQLGLSAEELSLDESVIRNQLQAGHPVACIMGPGDFTTSGHFIVLTGMNGDGTVKVNDPNSRIRSKQSWDLKQIMPQIRNLWAYSV